MYMFRNSIFNQDISDWSNSSITGAYGYHAMFNQNSVFNNGGQPLDWTLGTGATSLKYMFMNASAFNQDISNWNVSNILDFNGAFHSTTQFNQDLSSWNVANATTFQDFLQGGYSTANYDLLLVAWDALNLQNNVPFKNNTFYSGCSAAAAAKANMISTNSWTFTDRGPTACSTMAITSSTVSDGATSNNSTLAMTFTASASTSNFVVGDITVSGGALSSFSGSGTTYTATFTPSGQGATTIDVASGVFTDSSSRHNDAATQFNWTFDSHSPTTTFSPANSATAVAVASDITLTFNEAVRLTNNSALDDSNVDALITLKENNASGADIAFDATINGGKTVITINPNSNLSSSQVVYVAIGTTVEDASNNAINAANASFTAADIVAPTTTFSPANSATAVAVASDITLTFNEAVRLTNNSALDDSNVDALITLKENNSSGADIAFDATINGGKTVITINPNSNLSSSQVVYVAIGTTVEDASNNAINAANASFTAADIVATNTIFLSASRQCNRGCSRC